VVLRPSPAAAGRQSRRGRGPDLPGDPIATIEIFPGRFMQISRDPAVKEVLGLQQRLRKIIKNRRKIRKMQNQFCWFRGEEIYLF
jgi:hypothetical protein